MRFSNRTDAGRKLADRLGSEAFEDPVVLGLPRGGVPVAYEVATSLGAPLEVFVARKIGAPGQPELGIGAIAEGGVTVFTERLVRKLRITPQELRTLVALEQEELDRRVRRYRGDRRLPDLAGRDAILIDDGLATGVTAEASLRAVLGHRPRRLVLAVPVGARGSAHRLEELATVVCVLMPPDFGAVGVWYDFFDQIGDETVSKLLDRAHSVNDLDRPPPMTWGERAGAPAPTPGLRRGSAGQPRGASPGGQ